MVGGVGVCSLNATASGQCQGSKGPPHATCMHIYELLRIHLFVDLCNCSPG
jgi:hypothetical protein